MTSGVSAVLASSLTTTSSANSAVSSTTSAKAPTKEDTVQLSATAQKFLGTTTPSTTVDDPESTLEELVRAAAAGDSGALSLLSVV